MLAASAVLRLLGNAIWFWTGGHADLGWLAFSVLLAASALHPSAAGPARSRASGEGVDRRSLGVVIAAGATVPLRAR